MTIHSVTFQTQLPLVSANNCNHNPSSQIDALVQEIDGITVASLDALVWTVTNHGDVSFVCIVITHVSEVIMFSPCVFVTLFVSLSRCLSGLFNYEGLVPHKQYFAGTLMWMSSCASYVSRTHDVIDDVTRSQIRLDFESDISPSIFELERRSKAQNVGNAHGFLSDIFNFRYNYR